MLPGKSYLSKIIYTNPYQSIAASWLNSYRSRVLFLVTESSHTSGGQDPFFNIWSQGRERSLSDAISDTGIISTSSPTSEHERPVHSRCLSP